MKNQPLKVEVNNGRLEISIGVDLLCFAIANGPVGLDLEITDNDTFVAEILTELQCEEEDGSTPVHRMLDAAAESAVENGALGCEIVDP